MRPGLVMAVGLALGLPTGTLAQTVTLTPTPEGVIADYRLDAKTGRMAFASAETVRSDWSVLTPGMSLTPGGMATSVATDRFRLRLAPDSTEDGRGYIALTRLGPGYVLYAPALAAEGRTLDLEADLPEGWTMLPGPPFDGYVYLGPSAAVTRGMAGTLRISTDASGTDGERRLFETFDVAVAFFTRIFGPPGRDPVMSATRQGAGPVPFRGDVTDNGMISIRFHGDGGATVDADALSEIGHVAWHETAHLWNSHLARPDEGSPWLHEGGADYLALVGAASTGQRDQAAVLAGLSQRLTDCRAATGDRPDVATRIGAGAATYACGTVIHWLADMELRQAGRPEGVVSVWKALIDRARHGQAAYGPDDLKAGLGPASAVVAFLEGPAEGRWAEMDRALTRLNVQWVDRPSDASLAAASLRHLKRQVCAAGLSYSLRNGAIEMEHGPDCGPLAGTVTLASVAGHDPLTESAAMFTALQTGCARREPLSVRLRGSGAPVRVPCAARPSAFHARRMSWPRRPMP